MKKIIAVFIVTVCLGAGILYCPKLVKTNLPQTSVTKLKDVEYVDNVSAKGEVSKKDSQAVKADIPLVVAEVLVADGDTVKIGQQIITVNRTETAKKIMLLNDYSSLQALKGDATITSYDDILALIPKEVNSTIAGTIDNVNVAKGDYLSQNDTIVSLIGSDGLVVNASISENDISKIAIGQAVIISGSGFSKKYSGVVEEIDSVAKKEYVGTVEDTVVKVKICFTDADESIRVGYSANLKILTSEQTNILIVPYEAVLEDDNNIEYVYVFNNGMAVRKDIETGLELGEGVEVISGVTKDDNILMSPANVNEGEYVRVVKE